MIVIGSGAGGGTLVNRLAALAASGSSCSSAATGSPGSRRTGPPSPSSPTIADISEDTWYDADGRGVPAAGPLLRRRRDEALRRRALPASRGGLRRAPPPRRHLPGLAGLLRGVRALLHARPSGSTGSMAPGARIRPSHPSSGPYPFPAVSHEPRIQQLADDLEAKGLHPFHAPCGVMLNEGTMPYSSCVRCATCDGFPCLVHARVGPPPRSSRCRPALDIRSSPC